jgi:ATP-binding cassette subfamily B multidrug efflux pump
MEQQSIWSAWQDLWPYLRPYRWPIAVGLLAGALAQGFTVAVPLFLRRAIDALTRGDRAYLLDALFILLSAGAAAFFQYAHRKLANTPNRYLEYDLRKKLLQHLLWLDASYYDQTRLGDLMNRLNTDLGEVRLAIAQATLMGWRVGLLILFALFAMFLADVRLTLLILVVLTPIFFIMRALLRIIDRRWREAQEAFDRISAKAQENFSGIRVVKGFAMEDREIANFLKLNQDYVRASLSLALVDAPLGAIMFGLMGLAYLVLLAYGGSQVIHGALSLGTLVQFNAYLLMLSWPIIGLGELLGTIQQGGTSWFRLKEILQTQPKIQDGPQTQALTHLSGEIRFEHVSLKLGGRTVLKDINLTIPEGMTLGLTGKTGSGKTLLTSLIPRLYEPSSGKVYVGGVEVRKIPLALLRQSIAVVPQEPFLFSETIAENIAFSLPELDLKRIEEVARLAGIHDDILSFPKGYQTLLGERGITLSGGQRQRVALARALASRPKILILDEAMSAVDTETEARIFQGLKGLLGRQTTLLIAHRTSTLRHADWIVVLEDGQIVEEGTHEMLLAAGGHYAELDRIQRLSSEVEG